MYGQVERQPVSIPGLLDECSCPSGSPRGSLDSRANLSLITVSLTILLYCPNLTIFRRHDANLTWSDIEWIKSIAPDLPVVIKGIGAWEVSLHAPPNHAEPCLGCRTS
jgi:hypothetical protein